MVLVLVAFGHRPDFVAAVIEPAVLLLCGGWWKVLTFIFRINKEIRMAVEDNLHDASAKLRNKNELHRRIGQLLGLPAFEVDRFDAASRCLRGWRFRRLLL
jgi:hypothetical protein